jgi:hypothetical protein
MAFLSSFYPQPVVVGTTEGTFAEGDDSRIVGALPAATAGTGSVLASGSTTARTLSARFGEVFHVDDFGADPTGVNDSRTAIQNAINAAVAVGGGIIRFGANKTYRLNTYIQTTDSIGFPTPKFHLRIGSGNLVSGFGSTSMQLVFDGCGATLRSTFFEQSAMLYCCCQFESVSFQNIRFIRDQFLNFNGLGAPSTAISFYCADTNIHKKVNVENCYFNNCHHALEFSGRRRVNTEAIAGKLESVSVVNCKFDYPYGSGRAAGFNQALSGALVVFMDQWVDVATFDRCHADGIVGGTLGSDYYDAMHGFLFPMPRKAILNNCYFKHMTVETIKASDIENASRFIELNGNFTQPSVGGTLQRTVISNLDNLQTMTVGNIYSFSEGPTYFSGRIGFYRLEAKTGGGNYTFAVGESLNFTRLSSDLYELPSQRDVSVVTGVTISAIDMASIDKMSLQVTNCIFDNSKPVVYSAPNNQFSTAKWEYPSILCDYNLVANNNIFIGGVRNISCSASAANYQPTIINGNSFYTFSISNLQSESYSEFIQMHKSNVLITNNLFVAKEGRSVASFMALGANEIVVRGNTAIVMQPASFGNGGVDLVGSTFIGERNSGPWRIVAEDNYLRDLEHYVFANHATIGHFLGSIRSSVLTSGSSGSVRLAKRNTSPDGSQWTIGVTNDGELEVIK